jgi:hypothetical protein
MGIEELEVVLSTKQALAVCEYERVVKGTIFECVCSKRLIYAGEESLSTTIMQPPLTSTEGDRLGHVMK